MIKTLELLPGITLRCFPDRRFKQGCLSFAIVRPMCQEEAAVNALIPAVLLRGTKKSPDLRSITLRLDDLYGATLGTQVRRVGDYQTTGLYCAFLEDRFALPGDAILEPMLNFLREVLLEPVTEEGGFSRAFVESEKKNLIATMESELNDKRAYAQGQLLKILCSADTFSLHRLGEKEDVPGITARELYRHYMQILRESPIHLFYVGSAEPETVEALLAPIWQRLERQPVTWPGQTGFHPCEGRDAVEIMDVTQGKLGIGYTTSITNRDPEYPAMQVLNTVFGAGMTSKLFMNVREKLSLCYSVGSSYYGTKGIDTVFAGIDFDKEELTRQEIDRQLQACRNGEISEAELVSAKEALLTSLRATHDSSGAIEGYYATAALSGMKLPVDAYMAAVEAVTAEQVAAAARKVRQHSSYFLKGGSQ